MRFFSRLANLVRGVLTQWIGRREHRNPGAVYEAAIQERIEQYGKLREAAAGVIYMRTKLGKELETKSAELARVGKQLEFAVDADDDAVALVLIGRRDDLAQEVDRLTTELREVEAEAEVAKKNLSTFQSEIVLLRDEKTRMLARLANAKALAKVRESAHGIDLGPLQPRLRDVLNTKSGKIELAPPTMTSDVARLRARMARPAGGMVLIGRRTLRTSNSFMHNLPALVKGRDRCTLQISPDDASRLGLVDGGSARLTSRVGSLVAPVEITEDLMPGVVSLPHGWGHDVAESRLKVAKAHPGVNTNALTDDQATDEPSGTAVLFGTPVTVEPAGEIARSSAA